MVASERSSNTTKIETIESHSLAHPVFKSERSSNTTKIETSDVPKISTNDFVRKKF